MTTNNGDDYNPQDAIAELSASLQQPDRFAQIFCEAAKKQKSIDEVLRDIIKNLLKNDSDTQQCLKNLIRDIDKEDWTNFLKKIGLLGWGGITFITGSIFIILIQNFLE